MFDSHSMEDPFEIQRRQRMRRLSGLQWVLLFIALAMFGMSLLDHLVAPPGQSRSMISMSMGCVALVSYTMMRFDKRRWVVPFLVACILVITTWAVASYGSVRAASALAFFGVIVLAGTYLTLRSLVWTTLGTLGLLGALTWAEASGRLPPAEMAADVRYWMMASVIMLVIAAQLRQTRRATEEAHRRRINYMEDRLRLEDERDRSMRRFQRIFRLNPAVMMIQSAGTRNIVEVNPAFERALGYTSEQIVGTSASALWADPRQWMEHSEVLHEKGKTQWRLERWVKGDGTSADVVIFSELIEDPTGMLVLTMVAGGCRPQVTPSKL